METVLRGGQVVSGDSGGPQSTAIRADVHIKKGHIEAILKPGTPVEGATDCDVQGLWLTAGFVQGHTHLVQTLFRGMADDLALLDWLRTKIWPLEAAHDEESTYWSARLGLTEMLLGGTSAILDMASVKHTDSIFRAAEEAGIRAFIGKAMMDRENEAGLSEPTEKSLQTSCDLRDKWHKKGLLHYAFAPRFVPSCSEELLTETVREARKHGCLLHSHASENLDEVALVRSMTGMDNIVYLDSIGFSGPDVVLAHCIHLTPEEVSILHRTQTIAAHCPGSNFKLGSGVAGIPELLSAGVPVILGSDGSPCNNRMDIFAEMRLAALMQKPRLGPASMQATQVFEMATLGGAKALGIQGGELLPGKVADIVAIDPHQAHSWGGGSPAGAIVYACTPSNVRHVWIDGHQIVANQTLSAWSLEDTLQGCRESLDRVRKRAGL
ncbi:MAG: amidohydrolase family protein [Myxococcota bacterium]